VLMEFHAAEDGKPGVTPFVACALKHIQDIQIIDTIALNAQTGLLRILLSRPLVEAAEADFPRLLLLDATRGMQAVAQPVTLQSLEPCTL